MKCVYSFSYWLSHAAVLQGVWGACGAQSYGTYLGQRRTAVHEGVVLAGEVPHLGAQHVAEQAARLGVVLREGRMALGVGKSDPPSMPARRGFSLARLSIRNSRQWRHVQPPATRARAPTMEYTPYPPGAHTTCHLLRPLLVPACYYSTLSPQLHRYTPTCDRKAKPTARTRV